MRAVRHSALVVVVVVVASACLVGNAHAAGVVTISVGSSSLVEGDSGARSLHIPVTLNIPATTTVTVNYAVEAGNATAGNLGTSSHFRPRTGRLTWRPSTKTGLTTTEQFIAVPIAPNVVADGDETFAVVLSNPTGGAFIHQSVGSDGVLDDDPWVGSPRVSVGDAAVFAGVAGNDRTAEVPITLSAPIAANVTVTYSVGGGTATPNVDYFAKASGTVTFDAGKALSKVLILRIPPHVAPEPTKTVSVALAVVSNGAVLGRTNGTVTIYDEAYQGNLAGPKVAAIGDSIVFVSAGNIGTALADRYQYWIIGIPGYTIGNALPSFDQQLATEPNDVISNLGTDDALDNFTGWQANFDCTS